MKFILPAFFTICILCSCSTEPKQDGVDTDIVNIPTDGSGNSALPDIKFEKNEHNFGTIMEGEKVTYNFKFTNTGNADLVITSAKGSCGCTVADPPKKPIKKGEDGYISVTFDSHAREGFQKKEVTVVTNCQPNTKLLTFMVNVEKKEEKK